MEQEGNNASRVAGARQGQDGAGRRERRAMAAGLLAVAGIGALTMAARALRRRRVISLVGRRVLVTGASRGLGFLIAKKLAYQGARVALLARDAGELERARAGLIAALSPRHVDIYCIVADVAGDADSATAAVQSAEAHFGGPIDILVNNAGTIEVGPMEVMSDADYERAMRTHFWGPHHLIQAVLPSMRARRWQGRRIVNIASIGGKVSVPHLLPYSTSKFALVGYSEGLRAELAKDGIAVTTVCPGLIRTGSPRNATFKGQHEKEYAWFTLSDSLPGISMSADRCADLIVDALRHGDAEIVTSLVAKAAVLAHGIAPGPVTDLLGWVNGFLPRAATASPDDYHTGAESESPLTRSPLTLLTRIAEKRNNELPEYPANR